MPHVSFSVFSVFGIKIFSKKIFKIIGYTGHKPFLWPRFGEESKIAVKNGWADFTSNYHHRQSSEWAPISNAGNGTTLATAPMHEIYQKNTGLMPNYQGHVPGSLFR